MQWYGATGGRTVGCAAHNEEFAVSPEHSPDDDGIVDKHVSNSSVARFLDAKDEAAVTFGVNGDILYARVPVEEALGLRARGRKSFVPCVEDKAIPDAQVPPELILGDHADNFWRYGLLADMAVQEE